MAPELFDIRYTVEPEVDPAEVGALFRRAGMRRPVDDPGRIARMVSAADLVVCARSGARLVGIARSLTDFAYCCYLSDLAVDPDFQRRGIGRELVRRVQEAVGDECMVLLLAAPGAAGYYPHIGLRKVDNGWMLDRKK